MAHRYHLRTRKVGKVIRTGEPQRQREVLIERPDGSRINIVANIDPLIGASGEVVGAVTCFQDITDVKLTQEKLGEQEQRIAATYEHANIGIAEVNAEGRHLLVNEFLCSITGYSRDEMLKRAFYDHTHEDDIEPDRTFYRQQVAGKCGRYSVEKRYVRKNGQVIWVLVHSTAVRDDAGRFRYAVRVIQDITERKRAEERLRQSERRYRELIEALPAAVFGTTDQEGRITFYNQAATELWGCEPELGKSEWCGSWRLFWPDGTPLPHDQCPMAVALKEGRSIRGAEAVAERPDGTRVPFIPYPTPLRDASGALIGAVNMLVDISERKQAELRQKLLVDELNHRVKNTLATVQSLASQTARRAHSPDDFREGLEGRLMALSQAHDQLSERNWEHADLREIARASLRPYDEATGAITISGEPIRLPPKSALTFAMVFHELATNAAKYGALSRPDGRLCVEWIAEANGAGPQLQVSWRESGGPAVAAPTRRGFGSLLVERGVEAELGGQSSLDFAPTGVTCEIRVPLEWPVASATPRTEGAAGLRR